MNPDEPISPSPDEPTTPHAINDANAELFRASELIHDYFILQTIYFREKSGATLDLLRKKEKQLKWWSAEQRVKHKERAPAKINDRAQNKAD